MPKYNIPKKDPHPDVPQKDRDPRKGRTLEKWERKISSYRKQFFSKRLQEDLNRIPVPEDLPEPDFWDGEGLFLYGKASTGKTVLAAQLLIDVQKHLWLNSQYKDLRFTSVPKLFSRLKRSFNTDQDEYEILDQQNDTWLLVLDDLGVSGTPSDWLLETLYLIINHRYENLLPTIITSNLNLQELSDLYGDVRITSRIDRMCKVARKTHWNQ